MPHCSRCRIAGWPVVAGLGLLLACFEPTDVGPTRANAAETTETKPKNSPPKIAALVTIYRTDSHAEMLVGRILESYTLDGQGDFPKLKLASLYVDQVGQNDLSHGLSEKHGFPIYKSVAAALTLGGDKLAVDGVIIVAEHGDYPESKTGQTIYPKRKLFEQVFEVFARSGRVVPVFSDKHLADNWEDARSIYEQAKQLKVPMMAGSSLPLAWRYPQTDVVRGSKLKEIAAISYGPLDAYGFHALEMVQSLVERRAGGETGLLAVQCLTGDAVWEAGKAGKYDRALLDAALARQIERPLPTGAKVEMLTKEPVLFTLEYKDGLRAHVFTLQGPVFEWCAAWRDADGRTDSTDCWCQEARPYSHFTHQMKAIEQMMHSGQPAYPVERTLLVSGALHGLLDSKLQGDKRLELNLPIVYQSQWNWQPPPEIRK